MAELCLVIPKLQMLQRKSVRSASQVEPAKYFPPDVSSKNNSFPLTQCLGGYLWTWKKMRSGKSKWVVYLLSLRVKNFRLSRLCFFFHLNRRPFFGGGDLAQ